MAAATAPAPDGTDAVPTNGTSTGASTAATTLHDSAATSSQQSRVFALHTFTAENDDELSFQHGEFLTVLERDEQFGDGWWKGRNARGEEGLFPASYILPEGTDPSPYLSMQQAPDLEGLKAGAAAAGGGGSAAGTDAPGTTAEQQKQQQRSPSPARSRRASQEDLKQHEPQPQQQLASVGAAPETAPAAFVGTSTGPIDHTVQQVQQAIDHHHHESSSTAADGAMDGRDTRSRLAEQARLENERTKSRAASGAGDAVNGSSAAGADGGAPGRISGLRLSGGVPAGLVYSDESDSGDDRDDDDEEDEEMPMTSRLGRGGSGAKAVLFGVPPASATSQEEPVSAAASSSRALAAVSQEPAEKAQQTMAVPVVAEAAAPAAVEPSAGSTAGSLAAPAELAAPVAATLSSAASNRAAASGDVSPKGSPRGLASATTRSVHSTNGGGGGGSDVFGTPPLSDPATGGPFRDASPFDGHQPPVTSVGAGLANGLPPRENTVATTPSSSADGDLPAGDPATWSIHQVVQWASAKGFEPAICEKFAEHEITGDVLLDLDANLLKELEIPQFGKRIKIANAIAELKAPQAATPAATAAPAPVATRQSSFRSGMGMAAAEPIPEDAEARHTTPPVTAPSSTPQTPALDSAAVMSAARSPVTPSTAVNGGADQTRASPANGPEQQFAPGSGAASLAYAEWARAPKRAGDEESKVHQQITPEPPLAPAPESSSATAAPTSATLTSQHTRSASGSIKSRRSSVAGAIPPSPSTPNTKRSSQDRGHKKGKPSIDSNKTQGDRISFFGGGLGRNRKPAPRYPSSASTMNLNDDVGDRSSTSPTSPRAPERAISLSRLMGNSSNSNNNKEASRLSKQSAPPTSAATAPSSPAPGAVAAAAASGSAIDKIGKPDFAGYMKKKGDRYNSWKTRYFVLKGANLYYLRDENEQKVKGHIDLRGYKVLSDPNTSAGNYGFQIAHDQNKTHFFSSNEHRVIKEWMKQLMKATITRDYSGESGVSSAGQVR